ncbi:hypothetical protein [Actinoplanes sp. L3-i22]|uniref:hypothetical protein n=1 Tax=Actinoplanes sp. L3-i22 TaxID=2836373 RepID=UPI001C85E578|nr:hypothetical protein [Actinoplanes sp. L3-i22]
MSREVRPGVTPEGEVEHRDYVYGSRLGDEESGAGFVEIPYTPHDGSAIIGDSDCGPDETARANAEAHGWEDFTTITGLPCSNWRAQRDDVVLAYTHDSLGAVITFYRPTGWSTLGAVLGAVLAAAVGAVALRPLSRRPRILTTVLAIPGLILLPATVLALAYTLSGSREEPIPPFWTTWVALARLFFYGG